MSSGKKRNVNDDGSNRSSMEGAERSTVMEVDEPGQSSCTYANKVTITRGGQEHQASTADTGSGAEIMKTFADYRQETDNMKKERDDAKALLLARTQELRVAERKYAADLKKKQDEISQLKHELNELRCVTSCTNIVQQVPSLASAVIESSSEKRVLASHSPSSTDHPMGSATPHSATQPSEKIPVDRSALSSLHRYMIQLSNQVENLLDSTVNTKATTEEGQINARSALASSGSKLPRVMQSISPPSVLQASEKAQRSEPTAARDLKRRFEVNQRPSEPTTARESNTESPTKKTRLGEAAPASSTERPSPYPSASVQPSGMKPKKSVVATPTRLSEVNNDMPPPKPRLSSQKKEKAASLSIGESHQSVDLSAAVTMDIDEIDFVAPMDADGDEAQDEQQQQKPEQAKNIIHPAEAKSDDSQESDENNESNDHDKENKTVPRRESNRENSKLYRIAVESDKHLLEQTRKNRQEEPKPQKKSVKKTTKPPQDDIADCHSSEAEQQRQPHQTPQRLRPTQSEMALTQSQVSISTSAQTQPQHVHSPTLITNLSNLAQGVRTSRPISLNLATHAAAAESMPPEPSTVLGEEDEEEEAEDISEPIDQIEPEASCARPRRAVVVNPSARPKREVTKKVASYAEPALDNDGNWLRAKDRKKEEEMYCSETGEDESTEQHNLKQSKAKRNSKKQRQSEDGHRKSNKSKAAPGEYEEPDLDQDPTAVPAPLSRGSSYDSHHSKPTQDHK